MDNLLIFVQDAAQALDARGAACIQVFGLDRPELIRRRIDKLNALKQAYFLGSLDMSLPLNPFIDAYFQQLRLTYTESVEVVAAAKRAWEKAALDSAEFAGMVRANYPALPQQ